jgi:hypothetical protein
VTGDASPVPEACTGGGEVRGKSQCDASEDRWERKGGWGLMHHLAQFRPMLASID